MGSSLNVYVGNYIKVKDKNFSFYDERYISSELVDELDSDYRQASLELGNIIFLNSLDEMREEGIVDMDTYELESKELSIPTPKPHTKFWKSLTDELDKNKIEYEKLSGIVFYLS